MLFFRSGSIKIDFKLEVKVEVKIEVDFSPITDALRGLVNTIYELLSGKANVTYSGQDYVVDEVTVTNSAGQNTSKHKLS